MDFNQAMEEVYKSIEVELGKLPAIIRLPVMTALRDKLDEMIPKAAYEFSTEFLEAAIKMNTDPELEKLLPKIKELEDNDRQ